MCYAWFLSGYNYFNVVIDEKSAFNNARDCFLPAKRQYNGNGYQG